MWWMASLVVEERKRGHVEFACWLKVVIVFVDCSFLSNSWCLGNSPVQICSWRYISNPRPLAQSANFEVRWKCLGLLIQLGPFENEPEPNPGDDLTPGSIVVSGVESSPRSNSSGWKWMSLVLSSSHIPFNCVVMHFFISWLKGCCIHDTYTILLVGWWYCTYY